ncbi:hypothetical protein SKAU_G00281790 [Synaphobranchus kaupii]|uniref:Uncharacterized protein n=1 Tax=Synaphobranchus kaupii TaxID=118154 RepID=A0A9Q1IP30_SYNKA|nr:hypothetical protein SKAU_G00281790 [Synaphobranchus kaupii]
MLELGQTIRVTHLKGTKHHHYGFRLNSTSFTEIMEWDTGVREEEITETLQRRWGTSLWMKNKQPAHLTLDPTLTFDIL